LSFFGIEWRKLIDTLYITGLCMLLISLPIFNVGMSVSLFWVSGVWLIDFLNDIVVEKDPWRKFRRFWSHKWAVLLTSILLLHAVGMIHTEDVTYGMRDLRIKSPLFIIPFVLSSFPLISDRAHKILIGFFMAAVTFSAFTNLMVYWGWVDRELTDIRLISKSFISRISHIRLSLMCALAISICGYQIRHRRKILIYLACAAINLYFIWVIESITGFGVLIFALVVYFITWSIKNCKHRLAKFSLLGSFAIIAVGITFLVVSYNQYHETASQLDLNNLPTHTTGGEAYDHNLGNSQIENGHYVWLFVAWDELRVTWDTRSEIGLDKIDGRGQPIYGTLIRYMTSLGLNKDAQGVAALSDADVALIESGVSSILEGKRHGIRGRLDKIFLEIDLYSNSGDPSGHSLTQRLEFWRAGIHTFKKNWAVGVGTGDIGITLDQSYHEINTKLQEGSRFRIHNQYFSFAVAFGIFGFLWIVWVLIYPIRKGYLANFIFFMFYVMALTSFLTEDTIESQAGVGYFIYLLGALSIVRSPSESSL